MKVSTRRIVGKILFSIFAVVGAASAVHAENTPDGTVKEIVAKLKKEASPIVIVDYVNWKKAFAEFSPEKKEKLKITTPEELKAFFSDMLAHPSVVLKKQMEAQLASVPEEKKEEATQMMAKIEGMMKDKEAEMKKRLAETTYEIGETKVEGDKASVKLTQVFQNERREETVKLERDGGRWLLPSADIGAGSKAQPAPQVQPGGGAPESIPLPEAGAEESSGAPTQGE